MRVVTRLRRAKQQPEATDASLSWQMHSLPRQLKLVRLLE
jgi:hypothetical protein